MGGVLVEALRLPIILGVTFNTPANLQYFPLGTSTPDHCQAHKSGQYVSWPFGVLHQNGLFPLISTFLSRVSTTKTETPHLAKKEHGSDFVFPVPVSGRTFIHLRAS